MSTRIGLYHNMVCCLRCHRALETEYVLVKDSPLYHAGAVRATHTCRGSLRNEPARYHYARITCWFRPRIPLGETDRSLWEALF